MGITGIQKERPRKLDPPVCYHMAFRKVLIDAYRVRMCELAIDDMPQGTLMVDSWEATRDTYQPTAKVLDHFNHELNEVIGGAERPDGSKVPMRIILLAGADLVQTMSTPGM